MADERDQIEKRAYQLWTEGGQLHGHHEDHWRRAEDEVLRGAVSSSGGAHVQGDPDVPEERNPNGHDAEPGPAVTDDSESAERPSVPTPLAGADSETVTPSRLDDAMFLSNEFDIAPDRAAKLVTDAGTSETDSADLANDVRARVAETDALAGVPTPQSDPSELRPDADETPLKPVLRKPNQRTGAG